MMIRIVYNAVNVQSKLLAILLKQKLARDFAVPADEQTKEVTKPNFQMVDYRREVDYTPSKVDHSYIVAVELMPEHLKREIAATGAPRVVISAYDNQYTYLELEELNTNADSSIPCVYAAGVRLKKNAITTFARKKKKGERFAHGEDVSHSASLHFLVLEEAFSAADQLHAFYGKEMLDLLVLVDKYQNLETLDKADLVFVQQNLHMLDTAEALHKDFEVEPRKDTEHNSSLWMRQVLRDRKNVMSMVERTLRKQWVGRNDKGRFLLNAMVPRENVQYAARMMAYAHDTFMFYEDTTNCRIWTIVADTAYEAQGIASLLKPHDVWNDGRFVHCIADLPKLH